MDKINYPNFNRQDSLDIFDIYNDFDFIDELWQCDKEIITEAIHDLDKTEMKNLNIEKTLGTILKISIVDNDIFWNHYKGKMLSANFEFEAILEKIVEDSGNGIIVKSNDDSFICYFADKKNDFSIVRAIYSSYSIQKTLSKHPLYVDYYQNKKFSVKIAMCYGHLYKRKIHVQKKTLVDFHGDIVDITCNLAEKVIPDDGVLIMISRTMQSLKLRKLIYDILEPLTEMTYQSCQNQLEKNRYFSTILCKFSKYVMMYKSENLSIELSSLSIIPSLSSTSSISN